DLADVVAVVGLGRPGVVARLQAHGARLGGARQVVDLYAGVVVVELAHDGPAVGREHARDAVADRRGAAVADVQRAGRVGRDVFDPDHVAAAAGVVAVAVAGLDHLAHHALPGGGRE